MGFLARHQTTVWEKVNDKRMLSLDVFRGLTITGMILVNNPGSWAHVYPPLLHAKWHGWTLTDLVFPFFLYIVGVSLHLSTDGKLAGGAARFEVLKTGLVRGAKLFGLGLFLALAYYSVSNPNYSWIQDQLLEIRIMGVLQRIGLVFALSLAIVLYCGQRARIFWAVGLSILYGLLMLFMPYPMPDGSMTSGNFEFANSLAAYIDHIILGVDHNYYYRDVIPYSFDPEGLLSTLPAISTCLMGYFTSQFLRSDRPIERKVIGLLGGGAVAVVLGYGLEPFIPINKALWTPSYVLLSGGLAMATLAASIFVLDVKQIQGWSTPFIVFGANAIAFYMFSAIAARILMIVPVGDTSLRGWLYETIFSPVFGLTLGSLAYAITFLIFSYIGMYWMYKKGIFWKV